MYKLCMVIFAVVALPILTIPVILHVQPRQEERLISSLLDEQYCEGRSTVCWQQFKLGETTFDEIKRLLDDQHIEYVVQYRLEGTPFILSFDLQENPFMIDIDRDPFGLHLAFDEDGILVTTNQAVSICPSRVFQEFGLPVAVWESRDIYTLIYRDEGLFFIIWKKDSKEDKLGIIGSMKREFLPEGFDITVGARISEDYPMETIC